MTPEKPAYLVCPMCSAENSGHSARCFLCGQSLVGAEVSAAKKPGLVTEPGVHRSTFHLNSMMLLIALIAVFLGVVHEAPGVAVLLAVPGSIALVRTFVVSAKRRDQTPSWIDHVAVFLGTFTAVVVIAIAAGVSFFATCLAIVATSNQAYGGDRFVPAMILGLIVGVGVIIGLTVVFVRWSRRNRVR